MNKVIVIGCSGAGKSTFSRKLRDKTGLPLFHLDMLFWNADKTHVSREVFDERLKEILNRSSWIIDGNYGRTIEMRIKECDTVFLLDFPTEVCLAGVSSRIGKPREDMPWVEEAVDTEFKHWIMDFPKNELPKIYSILEKYNDKTVYVFNSRQETAEFLSKLEN